ncbi:low temperature requirement protein A [Herbaspirillum sp. RV1423]|uniref:low temperature requirement protein A n=1 Tax=Herbaspirillum sp. RV1423 TaxID=1443993 RepID=UPI0004B9813C|nr:low temperature requirement protein A [Herbaspirillum sp. RV1423]
MKTLSAKNVRTGLLRVRDGHEARVSFVELFFDLIYVFAVTQLSHRLLDDLSVNGAVETLVLWFAVWLAWQYTSWVTNWFDPETLQIRIMLFAIMLVGLLMAAAIPDAFAARGLVFAAAYATIQVGRTLFVLCCLGGRHALTPNFRRMLGWLCISAVFWIAGGLSHEHRLAFWIVAVACDYFSPMTGFALPGLGRSRTDEWTIEGGHLAERCQLFVIVALGEALLITGATVAHAAQWEAPVLVALAVAFVGTLAMWWVYFDTSSKDGSEAIVHSDDPGRIGAYFHYVHVIIVAGVIVSAVGTELMIAHPDQRIAPTSLLALIAGPMLYLFGNAVYKKVVYRRFPLSHLVGLALLLVLSVFAQITDLLMVGGLTTAILIVTAAWESCSRRKAALGYQDEHASQW